MPRTCILTDSTICFSRITFPGQNLVSIIPHQVQIRDQTILDSKDLGLLKSGQTSHNHNPPLVHAPSVEAFRQVFNDLGEHYQEIVAILISSHLSQAMANALQAAELQKSPASVTVIDAQTTATGLGVLVQAAAAAAQRGMPAHEINRMVRGMRRHIYAIFCLPDLTYLARSDQLDPAQAFIGEMIGIIPIFTIENGRLMHTQKIRSSRHMVDILYEFICEFESLRVLALIQGIHYFEQESRNLRERINQNLRTIALCDHSPSLALATILGPHSIGLIAVESSPSEI